MENNNNWNTPMMFPQNIKKGEKIIMKTKNGEISWYVRPDNYYEWKVVKVGLLMLATFLITIFFASQENSRSSNTEGVSKSNKDSEVKTSSRKAKPKLKADIYELDAFLGQQQRVRRR
jgi:hypothetical protein